MLFNSYEFLFFFLPISLGGLFLFSKIGFKPLVTGWLILISLFFYAFWNLKFLFFLLTSIFINWITSKLLVQQITRIPQTQKLVVNIILIFGIIFNLATLSYFKYSNFFIENLLYLGISFKKIDDLILPLGISFYTFEQISYLVGLVTGTVKYYSLPHFTLFVTFFPHLIAGPILSAKELIPQFRSLNYCFNSRNIALGFTIFSLGLFKKTVIADSLVNYATPIFDISNQGHSISFFLAWQAAISYTLQLYFDFSGYSDMAIGLAKLFNIKLPINFFSPYKAISIGDFWRRWHISLSRFLRDYLYIPLGGSRRGQLYRYTNLFLTMLLAGFWHGASWTFIIGGGLHGIYLCINHSWQWFLSKYSLTFASGKLSEFAARSLTFLAVVISWVIFRAETLDSGRQILKGMFGSEGFILPESFIPSLGMLKYFGVKFEILENYGGLKSIIIILILLASVFLFPNIYEFMQGQPIALDVYQHLPKSTNLRWSWRPNVFYALLTSIILAVAIGFCDRPSEFLYFQF